MIEWIKVIREIFLFNELMTIDYFKVDSKVE